MEIKANILIVDDRPAQLMALETVLEPLQQNLVAVGSGRDALRRLLRQEFAVILLDVNMPNMDGFETAALIRQRKASRSTPIIFVTGHGLEDSQVRRSYALGAVDYIQTPIIPEVLRAKVGVFVELFKHRAQVQRQAQDLRDHVVELTGLNQELEELNYSLSHDLRGPLRSVQGFAGMLLEEYGPALPETAQDYLRRIAGSARYMDELLSDLLDYGRLARSPLELQPVELEAALQQVLDSVRKEIEDKHAQIEVLRPLGTVFGHAATLKQLLGNLIGNALKFVLPGTAPEIHIYAEPEGDRVRIYVQDNGIGIPPDQHERIFGLFERLHNAADYPGTGIGLAIVRKAVQRLEGQVGVESESGKGSRFWVQLRLAQGADSGLPPGSLAADPSVGWPVPHPSPTG